jgi:hypothetical protein
MPLIQGKGHVSENIREFHKGPTFAHTEEKFGKERADKQTVAVALHSADKSKDGKHGSPAEDHKAAISKMHPEHLHRLVQDAHAGKFGPEAQQSAQQAMQPPPDGDMDDSAPPVAKGPSMFSGHSEPDADDSQPVAPARNMFSGGR